MPIRKRQIERLLQRLALALIRAYQVCIRSIMFNHCRFHPSCSQYAIEAIEAHGLFRGGHLTIGRLLRCHPWHAGGLDPVPNPERSQSIDRKRQAA